ncbi:hypothetical protein [Vreelandella alkaliphila]|uniref:hypothetical protein n=1 Tax=Vreelandella alkaliphila TaxID=272774 RepID=UPI001EE3AE26|nr:hypothetical protein [Halomonas alkaliphila]
MKGVSVLVAALAVTVRASRGASASSGMEIEAVASATASVRRFSCGMDDSRCEFFW